MDNVSDEDKSSSVNFVVFYFRHVLCPLRGLEMTKKPREIRVWMGY